MANRRPQQNNGRRNDRPKTFGRSGVSPWQGAGPGGGIPNLLPLAGGSTEATLALASNIINLLQPRQNPVPSLLDMPIRRDFGPNTGRFDRGYGPNRMGNQNFRRTGNYNRSGERINNNRKPFRPNDGPRQQNKSSPKKEVDSKAKPVKESDQEEKGPGNEQQADTDKEPTEDKKDVPKTRYDDVDAQLLKCHICNKSMWDGRSFENHLSGRAHAIMMQKTAESYALTADTMRQEFKIREMKLIRKTGSQPARDFYCAMCDMYAGDGAAHRTTVGHRKLKKYLHPACKCCHKEMPTRIELDEHRLTAEHLKNMQDMQEVVVKPKPEVMVISTLWMEQSYLRDERHDRRRRRDDNDRHDNQVKQEGDEMKQEIKTEPEDGTGEAKPEEKKFIDKEGTILDYSEGDDLSGVTSEQFPVYSMERGVGRSFLSEFNCFQCKLCRKLLDTEETAEVHLKTWRHHQLFLRTLQEKARQNQGAGGENSEQPQPDGNKRPANSEESGNWKRRKTSADDDNNDDNDREEYNNESNGHDDDVVMQEPAADEPEANSEMPPSEEREDWEQSVDDLLQDVKQEEQPEQEAEQEDPPSPAPAPQQQTRASPRGRGRGRGRGRRYYRS